MSNPRRLLLASAALGGFITASPSLAAETQAGPTAVGAVIVTAERRAIDIQKAALSITAVQPSTLDRSYITDIAGLDSIVPSFQSTKTSGFENIVTIRGVGSETPENDLTTVPGVSLFEDGVYLINTISLEQTLFDIDHIEVLRGPQGALYGQSSIGGAINIVTNQPQLGHFGGQADFSAGTYTLFRERGEVNIPIGQTLAVRLSAQRFDHDGFTDDLAIPGFREDDAHNTATKAAIKWQPTANFSAILTGQWYRSNEHGQAQKNINDPEPSPWQIFQDYPSKNDLTTQLYHLNLQYDFDWFSVRSVSAYQQMGSVLQEDSSRSAISILHAYDDVAGWNTKLRSYTEEFDILSKPGGPVDWIVGGFALHATSRQFVAEFGGGDTPNPDVAILPDIETNPPNNLNYGNDSVVKRQSYSVFAQATWHVTPSLSVTAGGRYNVDHYEDNSFNFHTVFEGPSSNPDFKIWDHVPTWRAEVDYQATPDNMVYVSAARGYKPSGVNGNSLDPTGVIPPTFKAETNTAFEVGSKNLFLDHSLRFNAAAFYYLYKNMQYIETDPIPFASAISNIPSVHVYGIEGEATYISPDSHLRIDADLALEKGHVAGPYFTIDSTLANAIENAGPSQAPGCMFGGAFYNPACWAAVIASEKNIQGNTPPALPTVSGSIDASYSIDVLGGSLTPRVQVVYRGSEWARIFNEPGLDRVPSYTVTNLNLEYLAPGGHLRLDLAATNVFNVAGVNSQYTDPFGTGQTSRQYIPPRQVIFTIGYKF
ncbi:MAG TPA: TonB-dependent receptor [Caulobacteraceae bacterium]|nr:TonB-dependent receptor [Caulobacteraceae bacterium]